MSKHHYVSKNFKQASLDMIYLMNEIIVDFQSQGYTLSVRQLYYQLVARDHIPNTEQSYKATTSLVNDARLAGLMDWDAIEDRTREFITRSRWNSPQDIMRGVIDAYHMDMWDNQACRIFVIVEKEALVGVLGRVCRKYDVPLLAARGYPSGTVLREFARDMVMPALDDGQCVNILHLGDHDPSGIDMSRDLQERIELFSECDRLGTWIEFTRLGLTMDQIDDQRPPPNPAKSTDSRFADYRKKFGSKSWELDALTPSFLNALVEDEIHSLYDEDAWNARQQVIEKGRGELQRVSKLIDFKVD